MNLEVLSNNVNATEQILMGIRRRSEIKDASDEVCEEVAKELRLKFERKENGDLLFKDLQ